MFRCIFVRDLLAYLLNNDINIKKKTNKKNKVGVTLDMQGYQLSKKT